jgi:Tfp pilus assembly protein PilE
MKKVLLIVLLLSGFTAVSYAQCEKKTMVTASKTEYLAADNTVERSEDEKTTVQIDKTDITVITSNGNQKMEGKIKSNTCNWTTPFKDGKTVISTLLVDPNGESKEMTITIEGKNGNLTLLALFVQDPSRRIRLPIDKFEEQQ